MHKYIIDMLCEALLMTILISDRLPKTSHIHTLDVAEFVLVPHVFPPIKI